MDSHDVHVHNRLAMPFPSRISRLAAGGLAALTALGVVGLVGLPAAAAAPRTNVIVQQLPGSGPDADQLVRLLGGKVTRALPIVNGFAATVPVADVPRIAGLPGVVAVTPDRHLQPQATVDGAATASSPPSRSVYAQETKAPALWAAGQTGRGATVALIDTGIADVPDLAGRVLPVTDDVSGQVSACENLSSESGCADSFGHGTFIAGIIAGDGAASGGKWQGMAPD